LRENAVLAIANIVGSACAAGVFVFHEISDGAQSMSSQLAGSRGKLVAWTLSRGFWQSKNFHAHRLRASSSLAKSRFLRESPRLIRDGFSFASCDALPLMVNDWCTRARA
jgi:hypothetical protein